MKKILMAAFCMSLLVGCGKRGKLDFPPNATYPRQYPASQQPPVPAKAQRMAPAESILEIQTLLETEK